MIGRLTGIGSACVIESNRAVTLRGGGCCVPKLLTRVRACLGSGNLGVHRKLASKAVILQTVIFVFICSLLYLAVDIVFFATFYHFTKFFNEIQSSLKRRFFKYLIFFKILATFNLDFKTCKKF